MPTTLPTTTAITITCNTVYHDHSHYQKNNREQYDDCDAIWISSILTTTNTIAIWML